MPTIKEISSAVESVNHIIPDLLKWYQVVPTADNHKFLSIIQSQLEKVCDIPNLKQYQERVANLPHLCGLPAALNLLKQEGITFCARVRELPAILPQSVFELAFQLIKDLSDLNYVIELATKRNIDQLLSNSHILLHEETGHLWERLTADVFTQSHFDRIIALCESGIDNALIRQQFSTYVNTVVLSNIDSASSSNQSPVDASSSSVSLPSELARKLCVFSNDTIPEGLDLLKQIKNVSRSFPIAESSTSYEKTMQCHNTMMKRWVFHDPEEIALTYLRNVMNEDGLYRDEISGLSARQVLTITLSIITPKIWEKNFNRDTSARSDYNKLVDLIALTQHIVPPSECAKLQYEPIESDPIDFLLTLS